MRDAIFWYDSHGTMITIDPAACDELKGVCTTVNELRKQVRILNKENVKLRRKLKERKAEVQNAIRVGNILAVKKQELEEEYDKLWNELCDLKA